jgi:uncharacterized protein with PQ loop repeat
MKNYEIDKEKNEEYNCIKEVNVCNKFKEGLLQKEDTIYGFKKKNIGYVAMMLSFIGFSPIVYNIYKTKQTNNFTYSSIFISFIISTLWIFYGINQNSFVTIIRSVVFIFVYSFILYVKVFY